MITIAEESEIFSDKNGIFAVYFFSKWMPFHKKMLLMIEKVEEKFNIKFLAVDVDDFKSAVKRLDIDSVPTVVVFKDNIEVKRIKGLVLTSAFKNTFMEIKNGKSKESFSNRK